MGFVSNMYIFLKNTNYEFFFLNDWLDFWFGQTNPFYFALLCIYVWKYYCDNPLCEKIRQKLWGKVAKILCMHWILLSYPLARYIIFTKISKSFCRKNIHSHFFLHYNCQARFISRVELRGKCAWFTISAQGVKQSR